MPFELTAVTECKLTHVNVRREFHGDEHVPAMDLSMRIEAANDLLNLLDPVIRTSLYYNAAAVAGQEPLPEVLAILPNLRMPRLNGMKFTWNKGERHKGYRLVLDYGLGPDRSNIDLDDCTVTGWRFETKEGGTVILEWVVQYAGEKLDADVRGRLTGLTDESIWVQLIAPPVLQVVKGKAKAAAPDDDSQGSLGEDDLGDGESELEDGDTPEKALERAA